MLRANIGTNPCPKGSLTAALPPGRESLGSPQSKFQWFDLDQGMRPLLMSFRGERSDCYADSNKTCPEPG